MRPRDFTWDELSKVLKGFGYKQVSSGKTPYANLGFVNFTSIKLKQKAVLRNTKSRMGNDCPMYVTTLEQMKLLYNDHIATVISLVTILAEYAPMMSCKIG